MLIYRDTNRVDVRGLGATFVCLLVLALIPWFPRGAAIEIARNFRRTAIEFDASSRRLRITKTYFGLISTVVLDSAIENCTACGLIEGPHAAESRPYCESRGQKFDFAVNLDSREAISALADQLAAATGAARRDVLL